MPVHILDVLENPEQATQEQSEAMLPFVQTKQVAASAKGPSTLWLQLHGDCTDDETRQPVDYENDGVTWCWHAIHDSDVRYVRADLVRSEQPAAEQNFCSRCGKRLGGTDDVHTCTPVVDPKGTK